MAQRLQMCSEETQVTGCADNILTMPSEEFETMNRKKLYRQDYHKEKISICSPSKIQMGTFDQSFNSSCSDDHQGNDVPQSFKEVQFFFENKDLLTGESNLAEQN